MEGSAAFILIGSFFFSIVVLFFLFSYNSYLGSIKAELKQKNHNDQYTIKLLVLLAKRQGATEADIEEIRNLKTK